MADSSAIPDWLMDKISGDSDSGLPSMSHRDGAVFILERLDYEQQLIAIRGLLHRNEEADKRVAEQMKGLNEQARKSSGQSNERAVDAWGEHFYISVYQDAAHSMAALGMIAPLFESLLFQAFQGIREKYFGKNAIASGGPRVDIVDPNAYWDCHNYYDRKEAQTKLNVVAGVQQLSKAVGLKPYLPADLTRMLEALFEYRNYMFHNGFEWPEECCAQFAARVEKCGWQDWFSTATRGNQPWIFYMTETFIAHCLDMVDKVLDALGAYCCGRVPMTTFPIVEAKP